MVKIREKRTPTLVMKQARQAVFDCDIHPAPRSMEKDIFPHLSKRWVDHLSTYGSPLRSGFQTGNNYPKGQPQASRRDSFLPDGGFPGSDLDFMRKQHLDPNNVELGVMLPLRIGLGLQNQELAAALCYALNEWQQVEWTSKEPRLKGSVVLPYEDPKASVKEIERCAGNPAFVQVEVLSRCAEPLGNRKYWPIFEAAQAAGLPFAVHAFGYGGWPVTAGGWPSYYMEDMVAHSQSMQSLVASMIFEGVFEKFPGTKLVLVEGGLAWLPTLAWRLDRLWSRLRSEVPDVKKPPSEYVREHIWVTSQPIEEPKQRNQIADVIDWIGWDRVLFASDYPHWDFDDPAHVLPLQLTKEKKQGFYIDNAKKLYGV